MLYAASNLFNFNGHSISNCRLSITVRQDTAKDPTLPQPPEFVPVTYLLPADYNLFVEEFRR
jgi:hypothetical protein